MTPSEQIFSRVVTEIYMPIYQIALAASAVYFIYGAAKYVMDLNNPEKQTFGKSHLLYGMIGLFLVFSAGSIVTVLGEYAEGFFK